MGCGSSASKKYEGATTPEGTSSSQNAKGNDGAKVEKAVEKPTPSGEAKVETPSEKEPQQVEGKPEKVEAVGSGVSTSPAAKAPGEKVRELADGVDLYTIKDEEKFEFTYSVWNGKLANLEFTLDASGSANMGCPEWPDGNKITLQIPPMEKKTLGMLKSVEPHKACSLRVGFSWIHKKLDKAAFKKDNAAAEQQLRDLGEQMKAKGIVTSSMQSAAEIENALRGAGLDHFIDVDFFPSDQALYNKPDDPDTAPVMWKRPKDFLDDPKGIKVFAGGITPGDIRQGALGDCWFLASLASLAEFPEMVKRVFVTKEYNELGVYEMVCYKNGRKTTIIVDDFFPCHPYNGKPCYSKARGEELWVLLLEKAWAKLHGSYEQIEGGIPLHAMMDICGATGKVFMFRDEAELIKSGQLFEQIAGFYKNEYLMVAGTPGHDNLTKAEDDRPTGGIVPGHAYTVKAAKSANGVRLLNLYNPWGEFEWEGDWSDKSELWTPEMREAFEPTLGKNDGKFWMNEDDFFKHFSDLSVVYYRGHVGEEWAVSRTELTTPEAEFCTDVLEFHVDKPTCGFITLMQKDKRIRGTPDYISLAFAVYGPCNEAGIPAKEVLRSNHWAYRELVEQLEPTEPLEPGKYVVAVFNPKKAAGVPAVLVVHLFDQSAAEVATSVVQLTDDIRGELVLCTAARSEKSNEYDYEKFECSGCWLPNGGYALAAKNKSESPLKAEFDFSSCEGFQIYKGESMKVPITLAVKDGMQLVAEFVPAGDTKTFGYKVSYSAE